MNANVLGIFSEFSLHPAMAASTDHTHLIRMRSTQLEMPAPAAARGDEDYEQKLRLAQEELERIQQQKEELARKKQELEELMARKQDFISRLAEASERLTNSITMIDRGLYELRSEAQDLDQCRTCFANHLEKLQKIRPEAWTPEVLADRLDRATLALESAQDDYEQAANHFAGTRSGGIFGRAGKQRQRRGTSPATAEFLEQVRNGLAFNLPILLLGTAALVVWLLK